MVAIALTCAVNWLVINSRRETGPPTPPLRLHRVDNKNRIGPSVDLELKPKPLPPAKQLPPLKHRPLVKTRSVPDMINRNTKLELSTQDASLKKPKTPDQRSSNKILRAGNPKLSLSRKVSEFEMKADKDFNNENKEGKGKRLLKRIFLAHSAVRIMKDMALLKEQETRSPPPSYDEAVRADRRPGAEHRQSHVNPADRHPGVEHRQSDVNPYWLPAYGSENADYHPSPSDVYGGTAYPDTDLPVAQPHAVSRINSKWKRLGAERL